MTEPHGQGRSGFTLLPPDGGMHDRETQSLDHTTLPAAAMSAPVQISSNASEVPASNEMPPAMNSMPFADLDGSGATDLSQGAPQAAGSLPVDGMPPPGSRYQSFDYIARLPNRAIF